MNDENQESAEDQLQADPCPLPVSKKKNRPVTFLRGGKFRPGKKMQEAILDVQRRRRAGWPPEFRIVALHHGVKENSLKKMDSLYAKGQIEMSTQPATVENRSMALANESEKTTKNLILYEGYLNDVLVALIKRAKLELKEENYLAFDQLGIPKVITELSKCRALRNSVEKGNFAALEKLMELEAIRRNQAESAANPLKHEINVTHQTININGNAQPAAAQTPAAAAHSLTGEQARMSEILKNARLVESANGAIDAENRNEGV